MVCSTYSLSSNEEFLSLLNDRVCGERTPLCGSIDLTDRCNLNCVHCYVREDRESDGLSPEQVVDYIDQLVEAGCLFLLFTGGEPLVRDDFKEIYEHAKQAGLLVSLFTNATLIDEQLADFLADYPPHVVEISIYGSTPAIHEKVTGVEGSFERTMHGARLLIDRGVSVVLKTILMTLNKDEIGGMLDIASTYGVRFRMDGAIFPRLNGDKTPLDLRLTPAEVAEREFMLPGRSGHWRDFIAKVGEVKETDLLYDCGAGVSCFHITSDATLKPCIMASKPAFDLSVMPFSEAWQGMAKISEKKAGPGFPCSGCEKRLLCDSCPGFFGLEMGDEAVYSEYVCEIASERSRMLGVYDSAIS